jgi:hypothetical protein
MLAPHRITHVASVQMQSLVPVENSSGATYVRANGVTWIQKAETMTDVNGVQAEAIYWLLASTLKLPVPDAAWHCEIGNFGWLSRKVDNALHWDPDVAHLVDNLADLGGVLALDALLGNGDRHDQNLLLEVVDDAHRTLWAIDAGNAAVGTADDLEALDAGVAPPHWAARVPVDLVAPRALEIADELSRLDREVLRSCVAEACIIARTTDQEARLTAAIARRCGLAKSIIPEYLSKVPRSQ